jgi:hypothetical protein
MKRLALLLVLMGLVAASGAWAQFPVDADVGVWTAHQLGMGLAGVAIADGARAWDTNPAGLSCLNVPAQDSSWSGVVDGTFTKFVDSSDVYNVNYSGFNANSHTGFGFGISHSASGYYGWNMQGFGIGTAFRGGPFSLGANYKRMAGTPEAPAYGLGALYRGHSVNVGLMVDDFNVSTFFTPGIAFGVGKRLTLALDAVDASGVYDGPYYSFGGQYKLNPSWAVRAGHNEAILYGTATCFGLGYCTKNWHADFGYRSGDTISVWALGAGVNF